MSVSLPSPRRVVVLGSTGSIGTSTLDVITHLPQRLQTAGLSAHSGWEALFEQANRHRPRRVVVTDPDAARRLDRTRLDPGIELLTGPEGVARMVADPEVDVVLSAIVGAAGLEGTWAALDAGKTVAVANKETLVMAGPLVMDLAARRNAAVLPVDSEHSAVFQAINTNPKRQRGDSADTLAGAAGWCVDEVERIVLTASGGPFRGKRAAELADVTVDQALRHPTWRMGPKITVDSATLMNKALEVIEARWLFGLPAEKIEVIIHPESIVHSFVEFVDGSVLAQLSPPDMRLPIQYALTYPERVPGPARKLCWRELSGLRFEQPDHETFPAIQLGYEVARRGGTCGAVLNAANEAAVGRFLAGGLSFLDIPRACRAVLDHHNFSARPALSELAALDRWARQEVARW
ncbi:MAG TPA: 1-deoxy-D-xylulose-5-phosphate reductoisomerase [Gemmataceae bacterium]|nr:1-deoxy-D-xylulose-5-phosphate reductoisomerase [Gemmataceae bacterium]